jgi:hypothetical protein
LPHPVNVSKLGALLLVVALLAGARAERAVKNLGQQDGFLENLDVKIPIPAHLSMIAKGLRAIAQDARADQVIDTEKLDLGGYVTEKALDGVFLMVGEGEREIRENPAA